MTRCAPEFGGGGGARVPPTTITVAFLLGGCWRIGGRVHGSSDRDKIAAANADAVAVRLLADGRYRGDDRDVTSRGVGVRVAAADHLRAARLSSGSSERDTKGPSGNEERIAAAQWGSSEDSRRDDSRI